MNEVMYVIAESGRPNRTRYKFVSTLTHDFEGMNEVLGYSNLDHALTWKHKEDADMRLSELPDWAKDKHEVYKVVQSAFGLDYYPESIRLYKGFILRICNDECSCDILDKNSWNLICIVGSMEKAIAWVDDWYSNQSS